MRNLIIMALAQLCLAAPKHPTIINNSNTQIKYIINGGKTKDACSLIGIGSGTIDPKQIIKNLEYEHADEANYLCLQFFENKQSIMLKTNINEECIIKINALDKVSLTKECQEGLNNK